MKNLKGLYFSLLTLIVLMIPGAAFSGQITEDKFNAAESFINVEQASKPSAPAAGSRKIYFKTDNIFYIQDEAGTETVIQEALPIPDSTAIVMDPSDNTKLFRIDIGALTTGTTRVLTMPDLDLNLGTINTKLGTIETSADVTDAANVDAAGAVIEADYNANTILSATLDDTPAALTISEQTVVGRITGGDITALTPAEILTLISLNNVSNILGNFNASSGPTAADDNTLGYTEGSIWVDVSNDATYICQDSTTATAVWIDVTSGAAGGDPDQNSFTVFTGDSGTSPTPGTTTDTLTFDGTAGILIAGDSGTNTLTISACDDDGDTCFKNEVGTDDDTARIITGGTERAFFDADGLSLASGESANEISADETLGGDSDDAIPTEQAVKAYVDNGIHSNNYLINGGMRLAQKGATFTSGTTYPNSDDKTLLDRWTLISDGNDAYDITRDTTEIPTAGYASMGLDAETANKQGGIYQAVSAERTKFLTGGTVSLSFQAKTTSSQIANLRAAVLCWTGTANAVTDPVSTWGATPTWVASATAENTPSDLALTDSFQRFEVEGISVDTASCNNVVVAIWIADTTITVADFAYITNVKLNAGSNASAFYATPKATELRASRHYFERLDHSHAASQLAFTGSAASTSTCQTDMAYTEKISVPTFSSNGASNYRCAEMGGVTATGTVIAVANAGIKEAILTLTVGSSPYTRGNGATVIRNGTNTAWVDIDAEIQGN